MQYLRIAYETKEDREQRHFRNRQEKELRQAKLERTRRGGAHDDVELSNVFRELGIDYLKTPPDQLKTTVRLIWEGKRTDRTTKRGLAFLKANYDAQVMNDIEGRLVIHFSKSKQGGDMKLYNEIAELSGQPRKAVKAVYEALIKTIKHSLKHDRGIRLPDLGKISVRFRKAKPKREGMNPFTGKKQWFKAKDASNKIGFRPAKYFKQYVEEKVPVEEPKKKHKKEKKHHKKHRH